MKKAFRNLKDNLARQGAKIIHYRTSDVYIHSTGHGNRGELEWLHKKVKPKFFIPVHGHHYMLEPFTPNSPKISACLKKYCYS
jgi:mRNA degradation ribonuclease J1/J2